MSEYRFIQYNWQHAEPLEVAIDRWLKGTLGIPLLYAPFVRRMHLRGDESVLDFGCGSGIGAQCIARRLNRGGQLTCVDISYFWMEKARQRLAHFPNVNFHVGDIREVAVPACAFDIVSFVHVLHDIAPSQRISTMQALAARLKAGGRLICNEPIRPSHGMSISEIEALAARAGLSLVSRDSNGSMVTLLFRA